MKYGKPDEILRRLLDAGFAAYYVGGCVRDTLLGRPVHDWDIATAARPEKVASLFPRCVPTGVRHGTVTVLLEDAQAEVTSFRRETGYRDGRHPDSVQFVSDLASDLSRRDFTVNAMAMDLDGQITDRFGGREDLARGVIRCVGDPERRFGEDALRMLRAYRFCAQLGFSMDAGTAQAVERCAPLCARLSRERVREETEKTLISPRPAYVTRMAELGLLRACGVTRCAELSSLASLPAEADVRWTAWKVLQPELDLKAFRLPSRLCAQAGRVCGTWQPQRSRLSWKRLVAAEGWDIARLAAAVAHSEAVGEIERSGECATLSQLAVTGRDFPQLSGRAVGETLQALLWHVLEHPQDNTRETLLSLSRR